MHTTSVSPALGDKRAARASRLEQQAQLSVSREAGRQVELGGTGSRRSTNGWGFDRIWVSYEPVPNGR